MQDTHAQHCMMNNIYQNISSLIEMQELLE